MGNQMGNGNLIVLPRKTQEHIQKNIEGKQGDKSVKPDICIEDKLSHGSSILGLDKGSPSQQEKQNNQQDNSERQRTRKQKRSHHPKYERRFISFSTVRVPSAVRSRVSDLYAIRFHIGHTSLALAILLGHLALAKIFLAYKGSAPGKILPPIHAGFESMR